MVGKVSLPKINLRQRFHFILTSPHPGGLNTVEKAYTTYSASGKAKKNISLFPAHRLGENCL